MSTEVQLFQGGKIKQPRLGSPKWEDPERSQSIKDDSRAKIEWQLSTSIWTMTCWIALAPARPCLLYTREQILILIREREFDIWHGEHKYPGCTVDPFMHGRSIKVAQPTIIFSSSSRFCRRNAKRIIQEEKIEVDPRGIGIEFYQNGLKPLAGSIDLEAGYPSNSLSQSESLHEKSVEDLVKDTTMQPTNQSNQATSSNRTSIEAKPAINAALVHVGQLSCTMGGLLIINGEIYGLTVAHAFESSLETIEGNGGEKSWGVSYNLPQKMVDNWNRGTN